jgi:putative oxidoreductase
MNFREALTNTLQQWQWIGMLLARLSVGLLFTISGAGKLFVRDRRQQMRETLMAARIPAPKLSAVVVSSVELFFGASLVAGFLTPLSCLMLIGVML